MPALRKEHQMNVLEALTNLGYGQSEAEPPQAFRKRLLPVPEHLRALDPDVVLVVGDRGTGKSALFQSVFTQGLLSDLARYAPDLRLPFADPGRMRWVPGHPAGAGFPDARGLQRAVQTHEDAVLLWLAYRIPTRVPPPSGMGMKRIRLSGGS